MTDDKTSFANLRRIPSGNDFLERAAVSNLGPAELTRRTREIASLAAAHADEAERLRRPSEAVWSALRASGFFYQFVPREFGGMGSDIDDFIDAALPLAEACPSTGWLACFCAGHNRVLAHFDPAVQTEIWTDSFPYVIAPFLSAPPARAVVVDGGYRVSGTWSWGSGIMDADWIFGMAMARAGEGPPKLIVTLIPARNAEVLDTWRTDGLAASGSNDVVVNDVFVPERMTASGVELLQGSSAGARRHPEPVFRMPHVSFSGIASTTAILGAARGAFKMIRDRTSVRTHGNASGAPNDNPLPRVRLAKADLAIRTAELLIRDAGKHAVASGTLLGAEQVTARIRVRAQLADAVRLCREAVLHLAEGAGSNMHRLDQPFQRHVRDISIMSSHVAFDVDTTLDMLGRDLVDLAPATVIF